MDIPHFIYPSSTNGHLVYFHFLTIENNAAVNKNVHKLGAGHYVFSYLGKEAEGTYLGGEAEGTYLGEEAEFSDLKKKEISDNGKTEDCSVEAVSPYLTNTWFFICAGWYSNCFAVI